MAGCVCEQQFSQRCTNFLCQPCIIEHSYTGCCGCRASLGHCFSGRHARQTLLRVCVWEGLEGRAVKLVPKGDVGVGAVHFSLALCLAACPGKFMCKTGRCIQKELRCDGWADCADHSDELNCSELGVWGEPAAVAVSYSPRPTPMRPLGVSDMLRLTCEAAPCHPHSVIALTSVGKPSAHLSQLICAPCPAAAECNATHQFTCKNSFCKPLYWVCDTVNDCGDNSDELQCSECPGRAGMWVGRRITGPPPRMA